MNHEAAPVSVWQVTEMVECDSKKGTHTLSFVLATSAKEAAEIVGEDERREIIAINQLCPISSLPGDKYRALQVAHTAGEETPIAGA